jgi:ribosome-binding factor A
MSVRSEKVASLIKEELSILFQRNYSMTDYGFLTVTDVTMSPDLRVAKVYISIYGDEDRKRKSFLMLESQKPSIRSMLGQSIRLRFTPELIFYRDESMDRAIKIENIFKQIHEQDAQREKRNDSTEV